MLTTLLTAQASSTTVVCSRIPSSVTFYGATVSQSGVGQTILCTRIESSTQFPLPSVIVRRFVSFPGPVATNPTFTDQSTRKKKKRSKKELEALMVRRAKQRTEEEAFFIFLSEIL